MPEESDVEFLKQRDDKKIEREREREREREEIGRE